MWNGSFMTVKINIVLIISLFVAFLEVQNFCEEYLLLL